MLLLDLHHFVHMINQISLFDFYISCNFVMSTILNLTFKSLYSKLSYFNFICRNHTLIFYMFFIAQQNHISRDFNLILIWLFLKLYMWLLCLSIIESVIVNRYGSCIFDRTISFFFHHSVQLRIWIYKRVLDIFLLFYCPFHKTRTVVWYGKFLLILGFSFKIQIR